MGIKVIKNKIKHIAQQIPVDGHMVSGKYFFNFIDIFVAI